MTIAIRPARPADDPALRALVARIDAQTPAAPREAGEVPDWLAEPRLSLAAALGHGDALVVAEAPAGLVGYAAAIRFRHRREAGVATVALGMRRHHAGGGLGGRLLQAVIDWPWTVPPHRFQIHADPADDALLALSRRFGFTPEGRRPAAVRTATGWRDELLLGRVALPEGARMAEPPSFDVPPAPAGADRIVIRPITAADATAYHPFNAAMRRETPFLMRTAEESDLPVAEIARRIARSTALPGRYWLVAALGPEPGDPIVGDLGAGAGTLRRTAHDVVLGMGVLQAWWGARIGRRLMAALEDAAHGDGRRRLSLDTFAHNVRGRRFYRACGFAEEAVGRAHAVIDGAFVDLVHMGKALGPSPEK